MKGLAYFGVGALAGALGAGMGAGISSALAGGSFGAGFVGSSAAMTATTSFTTGAAIGAGAGFSSGFTSGLGNGIIQEKKFGEALWQGTYTGLIAGASGALLGGISGGIDAVKDGRDFWHGGKAIEDISMNLPQMNQVGELDCRYEVHRSNDQYYNGSNESVSSLRESFPNVETNDAAMARMYGSKGLAMEEFRISSDMSKAEIAHKMANNLSQNKAMIYEMKVDKGFGHAVGITRVRVYDNGKILINFMNPSGVGGYSIRNFNSMLRMFTVFKF